MRLMFMGILLLLVIGINNNCLHHALEYQRENGGDLIFVQPLKDNGAYDLGRYNGHWLNLVHGEYIDAGSGMILNPPSAWFYPVKSQWWNVNQGQHPPFALIRD